MKQRSKHIALVIWTAMALCLGGSSVANATSAVPVPQYWPPASDPSIPGTVAEYHLTEVYNRQFRACMVGAGYPLRHYTTHEEYIAMPDRAQYDTAFDRCRDTVSADYAPPAVHRSR